MGLPPKMRFCFLVAASSCISVDLDEDGLPAQIDCNDADPAQLLPVVLHIDSDGDGFGGPDLATGCPGSRWLRPESTDCNDSNAEVFPGSVELGCNGIDDDCDPGTPDGPAFTTGATHASVQSALDAVGYYEWVQLCGSIISERVEIHRPTTLRGRGSTRTILDGSDLPGPIVSTRFPLVLEGLTLQGGGMAQAGGVLALMDAGEVTLRDVVLKGGTSERGGGLAVLGETTLLAQDVTVEGNRAGRGGGIYVENPAQITLERVVIRDNEAFLGGGLWVEGAVTGQELLVELNRADQGGGLYLEGPSLLDVQGARLLQNQATGEGGGVYGTGVLAGVWLEQNEAEVGGAVATAGVLRVQGGELRGNEARDGGALALLPGAALEIEGVILVDNVATGAGGGLYGLQATATVADVLFWDNLASRGGAGSTSCTGLTLFGSGLAGNQALRGGAWAVHGGEVRLESTELLGTSSLGLDAGDLLLEPGCSPGVLYATSLSLGESLTVSLDGELVPAPPGDFRCFASTSRRGCRETDPGL
jgi:predicted outer membrane repeat protein